MSTLDSVVTTGDSANRVDIIFLGDGYTGSQINTYLSDIHNYLSYIFDDSSLTQPFGRYENFFNIWAVEVVSNESGADNPGTGTFKDTALDASYYWDGVTERLLYVNDTKAQAAMNDALSGTSIAAEMRYVLVNDSKYGGGGGYFGVYAAGDLAAREIALHEIGHSFAGLADEYGGNTGTYTGPEPSQIDVTTDPTGMKWAEWLGYNDPTLGTVAAYEGGLYYDHGIYRPTDDSKMRALDRPFDPIAREEFIHRFYQLVDPIDSYDDNIGTKFDVDKLTVHVIDPAVIDVDWTVNGQTFVNVGETFDIAGYGFGSGNFSITARAYDPTDWVRGDRSDLEETITWAIVNQNQAPVAGVDSLGIQKGETLLVSAEKGVLVNDTDADANLLTVTTVSGSVDNVGHAVQGQYGALTLNTDGSFNYTAQNGSLPSHVVPQDVFAYSISDGHGGASSSTLTITILAPSQFYQTVANATGNGGSGRDVFDGTGGNAVSLGGNGPDVLIGGPGDALTGGNGPDIFVFGQHFGLNTVTDFDVHNDAIQVSKDLFADATDLLNHTEDSALGAIIMASVADQITLVGVTEAQLFAHQGDFLFV